MSNTSQASQRITALLDGNSFVEIGAKVTARATDFNLKQTETPSDGCITGYGVIEGNLVYVYSQDASVLGGSIGEMHAKKITNLYDLAMKTGAPVIGLIDSAGLRLQEATDALNAFGEIYMKQTLASGVIPQITAVFGTCGGGLALVPALTDFTFMEGKKAKLFVNAPNALAGNEISKCDTSNAAFQSEEAGLVDFIGEESEILSQIRNLVCMLPSNNEDDNSYVECMDDLNGRLQGETVEDRIQRNWVIPLAVFRTLEAVINLPFSYPELLQICVDGILRQNRETKSNNELANFWNVVSYLQQDGEIFLESDFRIDYLDRLKTNKVKDMVFQHPKPILRMRTDRIFMLYKKFSKQVGDSALPTESLSFYLENSKEYLGVQNSVRFKNILKGVEVTKEVEAGGMKQFKKTSMTKQALCFDYNELMANYNINLNVDMVTSDDDNNTTSNEGSDYRF